MIKTLIVGLGKSGAAAYDLLKREGEDVVGVDDNPAAVQRFISSGREAVLTPQLERFDRLVLSPGVPLTHPIVERAAKLGIPLIGEIELALERLRQPAVAITGTNGKTTATLLITHVLKVAGHSPQALGNIGEPLTAYVGKAREEDVAVVELSSFQLDALSVPFFDIGLILNITPDHLDRYDSMESYAASKCRLQACLKPEGELWVHETVAKDFQKLLVGSYKTYGQNLDCDLSIDQVAFLKPLFLAPHDLCNAMAAWVVCRKFGVSEDIFLEAVKSFKKPSHRIEWVAAVNGVDYVNDSKGTNIDATIKAVEAMSKPIRLIVGGVDKGASYEVWKIPFKKRVRQIVAIGAAAEKIAKDLQPDYQIVIESSLSEAVCRCFTAAEPGEVVLLSPGCSSFDMFRDYAHRGDEFKRIVYHLQETKG